MTVDITQEEMNILNLNGISADEVRDNIQYMRGTGLDDATIRNQYSDTINQLRPITKISPNDTANIKKWQDKGGITPFEYAGKKAVEFNGTYSNIDNNANFSKAENALRNSKQNQTAADRIANIEKEKAERNKRVNEGTASFLDRVGAALDRMGEASYQAQTNPTFNDPTLVMAGVDRTGKKLHEVDKSKQINFSESLGNSFMTGGWVPFVGGFLEKADDKKQREIQEHILKGEPIRQDELNFLNHRLEEQKEEAVRGYTWGGNVAHDFLPSLVRFGGEIASGGWVLKSLGWSAELAEGASLTEKVAHGLKSMAASGAVNTVLPTSYNDTYANYQGRLLEKGMELTDKGTWIFKESDEKPAISFLKSLGQTFVMFASESSGELIGIPVKGLTGAASKYVGTPISKYLASNPKLIKFVDNTIPALSKAYEKLNNLPIKGKNIDWLKNAVKYDGFIEELGEEVVEDIMNITLGTTDKKRTLENYSKAIFKSPDEWAVIAGAVALQGGTLSVASHTLGSYMERNGASDEQIIETLNNLTEGEKEQKIQELINENLINVSEYTNEESEKKSQLQDAYFEQIKKTGMDENEALNNATLMSEAFAALAKNTGMNLDDVTKEANIVIQNMSDEQAQQTYAADNSAALNGRVVFNDSQVIEDELQKTFEEFNALPEDYSDESDINNRIQKMQILEDIKNGSLSEENNQTAQDLIAQYEQTNPQLAAALRDAMNNKSNNLDDGIQEVEFQKIDTAGAENNQTALARQEWKNKGTESKFFKKWFGNSVVKHSSNDKPLIVYHGTDFNFSEFIPKGDIDFPDAIYFSSKKSVAKTYTNNNNIMECYLKIENPYIVDAQKQSYNDFYEHLISDMDYAARNGYDGVIVRNIRDNWGQDKKGGTVADTYIVFSPEQIKSVNNQGTFDESNPNIYYQLIGESGAERLSSEAVAELEEAKELEGKGWHQNRIFEKTGWIKGADKKWRYEISDNDAEILKSEDELKYKEPTSSMTYQEFNNKLDALNTKMSKLVEQKDSKKISQSDFEKQYYGTMDERTELIHQYDTAKESQNANRYYLDEILKHDKLFKAYPRLHTLVVNIVSDIKVFQAASGVYKGNSIHITDSAIQSGKIKEILMHEIQHYIQDAEDFNWGGNPESVERQIRYALDAVNKTETEQKRKDLVNMAKEESKDRFVIGSALQTLRIHEKEDTLFKSWWWSEHGSWYIPRKTRKKEYRAFMNEWTQKYLTGMLDIMKERGQLSEYHKYCAMDINEVRRLYRNIDAKINRIWKRTPRDIAYNFRRALDKLEKTDGKYSQSELKIELYKQLAGEVEARNTVARMNMTDEERRAKSPKFTQEYDDEQQLVVFSDGKTLSYSPASQYDAAKSMDLQEQTRVHFQMNNVQNSEPANLVDLTDVFDKVPTFEEVEKHLYDIINSGISFDTRTKGYKIDIRQTKVKRGENKPTNVVNKLTKKGNKNLNQSKIRRNNKYLKSIEQLINNSEKTSNPNENMKSNEKPHVKNYHNFDVNVRIGENTYQVRLQTEEWKGDKSKNGVKTVHLYNIKEMKKTSAISPVSDSTKLIRKSSDDSINETNQNIKPLFQNNDDMNSNINNARGFTYQRKNFDGTEKENLIVLLNKKADKSTLLHEFAHVYLITLNNLAQHNDRAKELLMTVNKWLHYDGVEYTEFQHERFANHFVAYVKSGKAPNYGLKKVFENFRKWLNDMYSTLQAAEDVWIDPETEQVFEELLGNITINAQKQEAEQIINKAHNNAIRRYNDTVEQLKLKFKKNQLTEYQKRYRDTALSIVHYALTHSRVPEAAKYTNYKQLQMILLATPEYKRKSKGVAKQQEEIGNILAEIDDVFSANDGFLADWSEFFSDTGVSYDTQEVGGDAELATQAFEVLVNNEYAEANPDYYAGEYGDLTAEEKAQTEYELEYIIEEYKNADDKTIPLLAYNEWSKKVHPYIEEDIQKEWERQTNEIDRYQALGKFEQAKEDLKLYAATLKGHGDYSAQFAEYARAIVKRLDFMTENDKAKLFDKLKEFNSFRDIERNLDDVMDYAQTLADVSDRRALSEQIDREVRQTIHVWQNGIKKTKYTYPANKLFERLREINKMSSEAVQEMYDAIINEEEQPEYTSDTVHEKEYYSLIEELFIKYKINGIYYNSTEFLQDLLERLQTAKYTAKIARDEIDFERRMKQLNLVDECARAVNNRQEEIKNKPEIKKIGKLNSLGFNFNGALRMIFNDKIKNWASFDYLYAQRDAQVGKDRREFLDKAKKIFGYDGKFGDVKLFNRFIDMTQKYYTITQRHSPDIEQGSYRVTQQMPETGFNATQYTQQVRQDIDFAEEWKPIETELSKMEVLYYYIQAKNPTSYVILTDKDKGQFDKYDFDTMIDSLSEQEKLLGDVMQLAAEKYWNGLNAYHIKKYHTELGKVKGYFPRLSEQSEVKMLDMFNDYVNQSSTGKFQKQRTAGPGIRIASANALAVLFDHIEKANTVIIMGEHMDEVNRVFTNPDLKRLIENTWGDDVTREFYGQLAGNLFTAQTLTKSLQEKWYGSIVSNLIKANIFFKPQIGFKQLISFMNYGKGDEYVSAAEWWSKFMKQTLTPSQWKKNIEFMMENDYLRDRFSRGGSMDALKKELDTRYFSKMSLLDEFWGMPVALGDISAIILGGKPYIDVLIDKGYTKEQAFRIFIETTVNDQQSSIPSTLSNMQRNASQSPLAKMAFAYQNTPWQYYRQCTSAIMNAVQSGKKTDIQRAAKMTLLYGWLFPAMFNMASSLSLLTAMGGGGDDDLLSDINPLRTITSVLTQHPILGQWINGILNAAEGKAFNSQDLLSKHISNINKLIRHFKKGEVTLQDLWNSIAAFGETTTGTPLSSLGNAASGVYDVIQGDVMKGALKVLGYTDYRAKQVTGEK